MNNLLSEEQYELMDFVKIDIICDSMKNLIDITNVMNDENASNMVRYNLESMRQNIEWLQNYNQELKKRLR